MSNIQIHIIPVLSDNYVYVLSNKTGDAAIVDPGEAQPVLDFLNTRKLQPKMILCTHHHGDHIGGIKELRDNYPQIEIIGPHQERARMPDLDQEVSDGQSVDVLGHTAQIIETPGHTKGHICYHLKEDKTLFAGDTLFSFGCGRVFEGTMEQMHNSLMRLKNLPDDTALYCGHEYTLSNLDFALSCEKGDEKALEQEIERVKSLRDQNKPSLPSVLGKEKQLNPFLKTDTPAEFAHLRKAKDAA